MPDGLTALAPVSLAFIDAAARGAGLARGSPGSGAAVSFGPLARRILGPETAVPLLLVVAGVLPVGLIPAAMRTSDRRDVLTMTLGARVGIPAGVALLTHLDPLVIR